MFFGVRCVNGWVGKRVGSFDDEEKILLFESQARFSRRVEKIIFVSSVSRNTGESVRMSGVGMALCGFVVCDGSGELNVELRKLPRRSN